MESRKLNPNPSRKITWITRSLFPGLASIPSNNHPVKSMNGIPMVRKNKYLNSPLEGSFPGGRRMGIERITTSSKMRAAYKNGVIEIAADKRDTIPN
ncbi:MAG: hypothetical protein JXA19_06430 [Anaerolineales bacterium]|nr:hypothetical protein [Anaerolineales bacterium]